MINKFYSVFVFICGRGLFIMLRIYLLVLLHLIVTPVNAQQAEMDASRVQQLEEAMVDLRVTENAWRRNDAEFRAMRERAEISETETREFAAFVAGLQRRVFEGCRAVRVLGDEPRRYGIECALLAEQQLEQPDGLGQPSTALTVQEEESLLMGELNRLESVLDGILLREQQALKQRRQGGSPSEGISGGDGNNGQPADGTGFTVGTGEPAQGSSSGSSDAGSEAGSMGSGSGSTGAKGDKVKRADIPDDVGTGSDDDIVARQLREAAESETDPVLREQLWVEYRKYKASTH